MKYLRCPECEKVFTPQLSMMDMESLMYPYCRVCEVPLDWMTISLRPQLRGSVDHSLPLLINMRRDDEDG